MSDSYTTSNGTTYAAHRGAPGQGYFVVASTPAPNRTRRVVAGPYTSEAGALERALELAIAAEELAAAIALEVPA